MEDLVASSADAERLLRLYQVTTLAEVVAQMVEWGDAAAFLDERGRLCVPDRAARDSPRAFIVGPDLDAMFVHYGVESGDLECLRRRMIFEGGWDPEEVSIEDGRIFVAPESQGP